MKYLDYLATHDWETLPEDVRAEISQAEYRLRREIVLALQPADETALPPALAAAFVATTTGEEARPAGAMSVAKSSGRPLWLLAAAGWLLFAVAAAALLLHTPEPQTIYRVVTSDIPAPEVITQIDTIVETKVQTVTRYRTVRDTIFVDQPTIEYVSVTDTLYVPMPLTSGPTQTVSGSRSLAGRERFKQLLFSGE